MSLINRLAFLGALAASLTCTSGPVCAADASSASAANTATFVRLAAEPESSAWWMRVQFVPDGEQIAGLPLRLIKADWCKANAFSREAFAAAAPAPLWVLPEAVYELATRFEAVGDVRILTGVYEKCAGERGNFLLLLSRDTNTPRVISVLETDQGRPGFMALLAKDSGVIDVLYCFYCDHYGVLSWSPASLQLSILPGPEVG